MHVVSIIIVCHHNKSVYLGNLLDDYQTANSTYGAIKGETLLIKCPLERVEASLRQNANAPSTPGLLDVFTIVIEGSEVALLYLEKGFRRLLCKQIGVIE